MVEVGLIWGSDITQRTSAAGRRCLCTLSRILILIAEKDELAKDCRGAINIFRRPCPKMMNVED